MLSVASSWDSQDFRPIFVAKDLLALLSQARNFLPSFKKALSMKLERLAFSKPLLVSPPKAALASSESSGRRRNLKQ